MMSSPIPADPSTAVSVLIPGNEPAPRRRLRSLVWNDFTKEKKPDGNCVAICNHCKKQLSASSRSGTTHLKNHLATCLNTKVRSKRRKLLVRRVRLGDRGDHGNGAAAADYSFSPMDQEVSRQDLARMIVLHGYPFSIVHHAGFKAFVKNLQPGFKLMTQEAVKADCMKIYDNGRVKLKELLGKLECRVNLTVDMWRSSEDVEYVCLTCHYVDEEWRLKRKILNFLHVEHGTAGEEISRIVAEKLLDWNIQKKLFSVILDNCHGNDVVARELSEFVLLKGSLPLNGEFFNVRAAASCLNAIAQEVVNGGCEIIGKVRDSVQTVRTSPGMLTAFQMAARKVDASQKQLGLDVQSNWITTYLMLETFCEFQPVFACLGEFDSEHADPFTTEEWNLVREITEKLSVFYQAIEKFSGAKIPTSNLYFNDICLIHVMLKNMEGSEFSVISTMASAIIKDFDQYWGNTLLVMAIAAVLDPRYKIKSVEYFFKKIYDEEYEVNEKIDNIRKHLVNLYNEYVIQSNNSSNQQAFLCFDGNNSSGSSAALKQDAESKTSSRASLFDARRGLDQYLEQTSSTQPQKSDLELYLDESVYLLKGQEDNFNVLAWWKYHAPKYPVLSIMARDILGIPVSLVVSDSEGRVLNQYLSSMDPVTAQGLICGQDWLREDFEDPQAQPDGLVPVPLNSVLDGDGDENMIAAGADDFSHQNQV